MHQVMIGKILSAIPGMGAYWGLIAKGFSLIIVSFGSAEAGSRLI